MRSLLVAVILALPGSTFAAPDGGDAGACACATHRAPAPSTVPGFRVTDGPTTYTPDNLFEYIDGAADAFLSFDLQELVSVTYASERKLEVTVDVYRHRDAVRAYGMYALERPAGTTPIPVGIEGHAGPDHLEFVVGAYYVKLVQAGGKDPTVLRAFADEIARGLAGTREAPAVLGLFPETGRVPRAEKLAARGFLGHAFLHDAVAVPYDAGGKRVRLFVIEGKDEADVRNMVGRYLDAAGARSTTVGPAGTATLRDPLNGEVVIGWSRSRVWGAVDQPAAVTKALVLLLGQRVSGAGR
jgi:hypothetical protein